MKEDEGECSGCSPCKIGDLKEPEYFFQYFYCMTQIHPSLLHLNQKIIFSLNFWISSQISCNYINYTYFCRYFANSCSNILENNSFKHLYMCSSKLFLHKFSMLYSKHTLPPNTLLSYLIDFFKAIFLFLWWKVNIFDKPFYFVSFQLKIVHSQWLLILYFYPFSLSFYLRMGPPLSNLQTHQILLFFASFFNYTHLNFLFFNSFSLSLQIYNLPSTSSCIFSVSCKSCNLNNYPH